MKAFHELGAHFISGIAASVWSILTGSKLDMFPDQQTMKAGSLVKERISNSIFESL